MVLHALTQVVLPVFVVVAIGWGLGRWGRLDARTLTTFMLYVAVPALLFDSLARRAPRPEAFGRVSLAAACVCLGLAFMGWLVARALKLPARGLVLTSGFMNAGNFGLPFTLLAWGESAVPDAITFYVTMALLQSTVGIWVAWGSADGWREALRLPLVYAAGAGLVVGWGGVELPAVVSRPTQLLAGTAIPLMLVSLGIALQGIRPAALGVASLASVLRVGGGLGVAWLLTGVMGLEGSERAVVLLSGSMPAAVMNVVIAERYNADKQQVATTVLISTLLAVVTVPLIIHWIGPV